MINIQCKVLEHLRPLLAITTPSDSPPTSRKLKVLYRPGVGVPDHDEEFRHVLATQAAWELTSELLTTLRAKSRKMEFEYGTPKPHIERVKDFAAVMPEADYVVTSPEFCHFLMAHPDFVLSLTPDDFFFGFGVKLQGNLLGRDVYSDPLFPMSCALFGLKIGSEFAFHGLEDRGEEVWASYSTGVVDSGLFSTVTLRNYP